MLNKISFIVLGLLGIISISLASNGGGNNEIKNSKSESDSTDIEVHQCNILDYDTAGVFVTNWHTDRTFAYMGEKDRRFHDSTIVQICSQKFNAVFPVENKINSPFGYRHGRFHKGLDIDLERGDTVVAAFDGIIRYSHYNNGGFGNLVIIRHPNGLETYYAHLTKRYVEINDTIKAGEVLGTGGNSGARHSGPHLHFEVRIEDQPINPEVIFDVSSFSVKSETVELSKDVFAPGHGSKSSSYKRSVDRNSKLYYVRKGDCLSTIARRHGTSVNSLCRLNGISTTTVLQIGQKLRIR